MGYDPTVELVSSVNVVGARTVYLDVIPDEYKAGGIPLDLSGYFKNKILSVAVVGIKGDESYWAEPWITDREDPTAGAVLRVYRTKTSLIDCNAATASVYDGQGIYFDHTSQRLFVIDEDGVDSSPPEVREQLPNGTVLSAMTLYLDVVGY